MTFVIIYAFPGFDFPFSKIKTETISDSRGELVKVSWSVTVCGHFHLYLWGFVTQTRTVFFLFFCFAASTFSPVHGRLSLHRQVQLATRPHHTELALSFSTANPRSRRERSLPSPFTLMGVLLAGEANLRAWRDLSSYRSAEVKICIRG